MLGRGGGRVKHNKYAKELLETENNEFQLTRCTPGMADLMLRLYDIRIECGGMELEELAAKQAERQTMAKLDDFEIQKVRMDQLLQDTRNLLEEKEKGDIAEAHLNTNIAKNLSQIEKIYKKMNQMIDDSKNNRGKWAFLKKKVPEEVLKKRETDMELIKDFIDITKEKQKRLLMGGGRKKDPVTGKIVHTSIEDLKKQEKELPTIDISAGLQQIEDRKREQDRLLGVIDDQLNTMTGMATAISSELDLHAKMIDRLDDDAEKYKKSLDQLNVKVEKIIEDTGGAPKYIIGAIISVVGLVVLIFLIVAVKNLVG